MNLHQTTPTSVYSRSTTFHNSSYPISSPNSRLRPNYTEASTVVLLKKSIHVTKIRMGTSNGRRSGSNPKSISRESQLPYFSNTRPEEARNSPALKNSLSNVRRLCIWDIIPKDVDVTVAKHISTSCYDNALMFAKQSTRQGQAMAEALEYRLVLNDVYKEDMKDWISIFGNATRHLDISHLRETPLPSNFRDLPRLKKADIIGIKSHYNVVQSSPRLSTLRVVLDKDAVWDDLVEVCKTLPLEELCLDCGLNDYCCRQSVSIDQLFCLADACPNVTKLDMKCSCEHTKSFWPMVVSFKSLKHLKLYGKIEHEAMDFLRRLQEVEFCEQNIPIRHIFPISQNITTVTQLRRARIDTVLHLEHFPRLRRLRLAMVDGAEEVLPKVIEKVEVLDLSWGYDDFYDGEEDIEYGDGSMDFDMDVINLYQPNPKVIEEILHSAQYLRELHLRRAVVKIELLEKIIMTIGRRLEKLSIHMDGQDEQPAIRLTRILLALAKHSPHIKRLALLDTLMDKEATLQEKNDCYRALEVLKNRSPFAPTHKIQQFIDGIEEVN